MNAAIDPEPDPAGVVLENLVERLLEEAVLGGAGEELTFLEADEPAIRGQPKHAVGMLVETPDPPLHETVALIKYLEQVRGVRSRQLIPHAADSAAVGPNPELTRRVFKKCAHVRMGKTVASRESLVAAYKTLFCAEPEEAVSGRIERARRTRTQRSSFARRVVLGLVLHQDHAKTGRHLDHSVLAERCPHHPGRNAPDRIHAFVCGGSAELEDAGPMGSPLNDSSPGAAPDTAVGTLRHTQGLPVAVGFLDRQGGEGLTAQSHQPRPIDARPERSIPVSSEAGDMEDAVRRVGAEANRSCSSPEG